MSGGDYVYSIAFPNMFTNSKTNLIDGKDATASNLKLLLKSRRGSLIGDPNFGTDLMMVFFNQNSPILADLIVDEIYTTIVTMVPQISVDRKDITIESDGVDVVANLKLVNKEDFTTNLYQINLTNTEYSEE